MRKILIMVINGEVINNMRYADDTVLLTSNLEDTFGGSSWPGLSLRRRRGPMPPFVRLRRDS